MNSIILKNTNIGDNVIIGAGSIVSGNIESNSVYAGNPARKIMSIEEFYNKRKNRQKEELINISKMYKERYNKRPNSNNLREYFFLYKNREKNLSEKEEELINNTGNEYNIINNYKKSIPTFNGLEELFKSINL